MIHPLFSQPYLILESGEQLNLKPGFSGYLEVRFTCGRKYGTSSVTSRAKIRNTASNCITYRDYPVIWIF